MAAIIWTDVTGIAAPELATAPAAAQTAILAYVNSVVDVSAYDGEDGFTTKLARVFLAAHRGSLVGFGLGGVVIAESEGALSTQYAAPKQTDDDLNMTAYGRQYLGLVRKSNARAWVLL